MQAGQPLGLVGNNGNSDEPHLHFHVADGPARAALAANGRPYVFGGFRLDGRLRGLDSGSPTLVRPPPPRNRTSQLPLHGDILAFP